MKICAEAHDAQPSAPAVIIGFSKGSAENTAKRQQLKAAKDLRLACVYPITGQRKYQAKCKITP
jgi:hypothetical protein